MLFDEEITIIVQTDSTAPVQSVNGKIGFVSIDKSDVGLSNVENVSILGASGHLQYQINNLDISGGYATDLELNTTSGVLNQKINNLSGDTDNKFYLKSNPSGFLTGVDLSALYPRNNPSGYITGVDTSNFYTKNNPSGFITGVDTSNFYTKNNPSGFITGVDTSNFYTKNNPSGFITGVDLSNYATTTNLNLTGSNLASNLATTGSTLSANLATTGSTLTTQINNLSGVSVLTYGNQTIDGTKTFRNSVYINNLYVTGTETIVNTPQINIASNYLLLNLTGGAVDGGIFFVTGTNGTGINEYGPIIGFDHSDKFKFGIGRRSEDLSLLNDIAAVQDITNYSGFVNNKYATILNLGSTGQNLQQQINNINSSGFITGVDLSNLYPRNNPSGFITGIDTSNFYTKNNPSGFITGVDLSSYVTTSQTGNFYTNNNPSGYITGVDLSNYYTKDNPSGFITGIDLSNYATTGQLSQASGNLQNQINNLGVSNSIAFAIALG
jgi:hypothetical protein